MIRGASAALVVYDITSRCSSYLDKASYESVKKWTEQMRAVEGKDVVIVVVGNKADLSGERVVSFEECQEKARELEALFCEASAKCATNVH